MGKLHSQRLGVRSYCVAFASNNQGIYIMGRIG